MSSFLSPLANDPTGRWTLRDASTKRVIATQLEAAFESDARRRGLLGRDRIDPGTAMVIAPCSSIHTFFMRFAIDVIFASRDGRVIKLYHNLPAWRIAIGPGAYAAIELAGGALALGNAAALERTARLEIVRSDTTDT